MNTPKHVYMKTKHVQTLSVTVRYVLGFIKHFICIFQLSYKTIIFSVLHITTEKQSWQQTETQTQNQCDKLVIDSTGKDEEKNQNKQKLN